MDVISRNLGCAGDGRETSRLAMQRSEVPLATLSGASRICRGDGER